MPVRRLQIAVFVRLAKINTKTSDDHAVPVLSINNYNEFYARALLWSVYLDAAAVEYGEFLPQLHELYCICQSFLFLRINIEQ